MAIGILRLCLFQSTLPCGERRPGRGSSTIYLMGFNPRSRAGSDYPVRVDAPQG